MNSLHPDHFTLQQSNLDRRRRGMGCFVGLLLGYFQSYWRKFQKHPSLYSRDFLPVRTNFAALIKYFVLKEVEYSKATVRTSDQCQTVMLTSNCSGCY